MTFNCYTITYIHLLVLIIVLLLYMLAPLFFLRTFIVELSYSTNYYYLSAYILVVCNIYLHTLSYLVLSHYLLVKTSNMTLLQWPQTSKAKDTPLEEESGSTTVDVEQQHTSLNLKCGSIDTTFEIAAYVYQSPGEDVTLNKPLTKAGDTINQEEIPHDTQM